MEIKERVLVLIDEAHSRGVRLSKAFEVLEMSARTYYKWKSDVREGTLKDGRAGAAKHVPNKLTEEENQEMRNVLADPTYARNSPDQIVPQLMTLGLLIASESSFYRLMRREGLIQHRLNTKPREKTRKPKELVATGPNQVWSWDITYLPGAIRGQFYYLYVILDIFSRKIVGSSVHEEESSAHAAELIERAAKEQGLQQDRKAPLVLHSDNGSPMKGFTMLAKLYELGIAKSFSRPGVSNDNPFSESQFKTLKYHVPEVPRNFATLEAAQKWAQKSITWYNEKHVHSGIGFVTPEQRHRELDRGIQETRKEAYEAARKRVPWRYKGQRRKMEYIEEVHLNRYENTLKNQEERLNTDS